MSAATARSARGASAILELDEDELAFRGALGVLTAAAALFTACVAATPPRVHEAIVDVETAGGFVMDLPRLPMPEPVVEHVRPVEKSAEGGGREQRRSPARAPAAEAHETSARPGSLLLQQLGTLAPGSALSTVLADGQTARLDEALRGVTGARVAEAGESARSGRRIGDEELGVGLLGRSGEGGLGAGGKVALKGLVTAEAPEVDGGAGGDAAAIARIVRGNQGRITTCLEQSLKRDPSLDGRVDLAWSIAAGRVSDVHVVGNSTRDPELASCMQRAVLAMHFPVEITADVAKFPWMMQAR